MEAVNASTGMIPRSQTREGHPRVSAVAPGLARISHNPAAACSNLSICSGTPGAPYLPGFGRCGIPRLSTRQSIPATNLGAWAIRSLHSLGSAFVESHICQNRADMGHPGVPLRVGSFDRKLLVRNAG
jgi:hypothetical protein